MTRTLLAAATFVLALLPAAARLAAQNVPLPAGPTGLTIYNDGRVLVRRTFVGRVPKGASTLTVPIGTADPATLFSLDPEVRIERAIYDAAVDEPSVLRRAVGSRLVFRTGIRYGPNNTPIEDTLSALVLGVDPLRLQLPSGRIAFSMPGQPLYPAELVRIEPALSLGIESASARDDLRLGYFGSGANWQASYSAILAGGNARVSGLAVITSEALRATDAEVQLLAGSVSSAAPPPILFQRQREMANAVSMDAAAGKMTEQRVGEFHLYSLPGRHTLLPGQTTSAALFDPATTPYERSYVVRGEIPFWGYLPQQPEEGEVPVQVNFTLRRARTSEFGDRPLPGGVARLYQADSAGRLQLVGEAATDHTPAGEDLRLSAGTAFDLTAKRVQTSYVTRRDSVAGGWRTTVDAGYRVTLTNATDSSAVVNVEERRGGDWRVVTSSLPPQKVSSTLTRFRVTVPARGQAELSYRVRVTW